MTRITKSSIFRTLVAVVVVMAILIGAASAGNATGVTAIEVPGAGLVVLEPNAPEEDVAAAVANAKDVLSPEEAAEEAAADAAFEVPSLEPFADQGAASEVSAVKEAALALLDRDLEAQQSDVDPAATRALLERVYSRDVLAAEIELLLDAKADAAAGLLPNTEFTDHRISPEDWLGVKVEETSAVALLTGRQALLWNGTWEQRRYTWRFDLVREGGDWRLARLSFDDLGALR